jgi:precorrin-8X/cobalt-precorrin-8 methylmutase
MQAADWKLGPAEIEARSFALIDAEAGDHGWPPDEWAVVRRLVHTSADFDWVSDLIITPGAVAAGVAALREGAKVFTDTKMALSGINLARLGALASRPSCLIDDPRVAEAARADGLTRAMAAVDLALDAEAGPAGAVWVFGNAPTALLRLIERLAADPGLPRPRLVVGLPVGFVNAAESKRALAESGLPHFITNRGRKGGSNVAAAAINALAALARSSGS